MSSALLTSALASTLLAQSALPSPLSLPPQVGRIWHYRVQAVPADDPQDEPIPGTYELRITDVKSLGADRLVLEVREHDSFTGRYRISEWEQSKAAVLIRDVDYPGPFSTQTEGATLEFLSLPFASGKKHDDGQWSTEILSQEPVSVPGFTTPQMTWKISVIGTQADHYTAVGTYWIMPGWGIVRSHLNAHGWISDAIASFVEFSR